MIRMRVNEKEESICDECGCKWSYTREMADILICGKKITICYNCRQQLFSKLLTIDRNYDSKLKSKKDLRRLSLEHKMEENKKC